MAWQMNEVQYDSAEDDKVGERDCSRDERLVAPETELALNSSMWQLTSFNEGPKEE